ncbi:MAG: GTPase [Candidatus Woesearchaeota archaeon]
MPSYWRHVNRVLKEADLIIEVLDSRLIEGTRNAEIESKIKNLKKKLLFVINKCDLVDKNKMDAIRKVLKPSVFISSKDHLGTTMLKKKILELSRGEKVVVGIVGYPNVGKSSLINALSGRHAARTSSESGHTKGMQRIKVDNKIMVLDTPGVLPNQEENLEKHVKMGAIDYSKIKDTETAALNLIEGEIESICKHYKVSGNEPEEILENIAKKMNKLGKGGTLNLESTGRAILKDWQTGKIK